MLMKEVKTIVAPSDGAFWGGVAIGTASVLVIGAAACC